MADVKKFLDAEGVKHLWSKVNMQDYPNNEMLIGVINAIDETKANKDELVKVFYLDINNPSLTDDEYYQILGFLTGEGPAVILCLKYDSYCVAPCFLQYGDWISQTATFRGTVYDSAWKTNFNYEVKIDNSGSVTVNQVSNYANENEVQAKITGTSGQFVVIGDDGNVTTKTIPYAEEASF